MQWCRCNGAGECSLDHRTNIFYHSKVYVVLRALLVWMFWEMIEFFWPNSRALLPIFSTNCPDGSHFAQMGSHFAQKTTPNPCSLLSRPSHMPFGDIKHPQANLKTPPFLAWTWKWAKWNSVLAILTSTGPNIWKVGKKILEVGNFVFLFLRAPIPLTLQGTALHVSASCGALLRCTHCTCNAGTVQDVRGEVAKWHTCDKSLIWQLERTHEPQCHEVHQLHGA